MPRYCLALLVVIGMPGCATKLETTWQAVHLVDGLQTLAIARDTDCYSEVNWPKHLIGENPSEAEVVAWWAGTAIAHAWVTRQLEPWPRWQKVWGWVTLVGTTTTVVENHQEGLRVYGDNRPHPVKNRCGAAWEAYRAGR